MKCQNLLKNLAKTNTYYVIVLSRLSNLIAKSGSFPNNIKETVTDIKHTDSNKIEFIYKTFYFLKKIALLARVLQRNW